MSAATGTDTGSTSSLFIIDEDGAVFLRHRVELLNKLDDGNGCDVTSMHRLAQKTTAAILNSNPATGRISTVRLGVAMPLGVTDRNLFELALNRALNDHRMG